MRAGFVSDLTVGIHLGAGGGVVFRGIGPRARNGEVPGNFIASKGV
jgi:hypothetical protein